MPDPHSPTDGTAPSTSHAVREPMHAKPGSSGAAAQPGHWDSLAPATREKLGFRPETAPSVLTFAGWSPDPWTVVGANGKPLATLSKMNLSVIKAVTTAGAPSLYWTLTLNVASHGWTSSEPGQPQVQARLQVQLLNAASGLLLGFAPLFYVECGGNSSQTLSDPFTVDVFSAIAKAHLSLNATFWPC